MTANKSLHPTPACTFSGTRKESWRHEHRILLSIKEAIDKRIVVVISTRVPNGRVLPIYGTEGGGKTLKDAGAIFADNLSPQKARILLMLALQTTSKAEEIQKLFNR